MYLGLVNLAPGEVVCPRVHYVRSKEFCSPTFRNTYSGGPPSDGVQNSVSTYGIVRSIQIAERLRIGIGSPKCLNSRLQNVFDV